MEHDVHIFPSRINSKQVLACSRLSAEETLLAVRRDGHDVHEEVEKTTCVCGLTLYTFSE